MWCKVKTPQPTLDIWGLNNRAPDTPLNPDGDAPSSPTPRPRDWKGSAQSVFKTLGASSHCDDERQRDDFYATPTIAVEMLLELESFSHKVREPSCGAGHIAKVFEAHGHEVDASDLVYRGYGRGGVDFLKSDEKDCDYDLVQNPPYSLAQAFIEKGMEAIGEGHKMAAFLKLTFLEGKSRYPMFQKHPPKAVYVSVSRLGCGKNGTEWNPSAVCYAWFVWEKGYKGEPAIRWFNTPDSTSAAVAPAQPQLAI